MPSPLLKRLIQAESKGKEKPAVHQYYVIKINADRVTEKISVGQ